MKAGGVTLSGGEPLFQPDFTEALVNELSLLGIHVAVDTCGYASREIFERLLPKVHLWLFDFKGADIEKHKENTGVKPDLILQNLDFLISQKAEIILRYPVVPGFNDTEFDISALFHLLDKSREGLKRCICFLIIVWVKISSDASIFQNLILFQNPTARLLPGLLFQLWLLCR